MNKKQGQVGTESSKFLLHYYPWGGQVEFFDLTYHPICVHIGHLLGSI